eukprot:g2262.t1
MKNRDAEDEDDNANDSSSSISGEEATTDEEEEEEEEEYVFEDDDDDEEGAPSLREIASSYDPREHSKTFERACEEHDAPTQVNIYTKSLNVFPGHRGGVWSLCTFAKGKRLLTGSYDRTLRIWDTFGGQCIRTLDGGHKDGVTAVAVTPDDRILISACQGGHVVLWDAATGNLTYTFRHAHLAPVWTVRVTRDGKYLLTGAGDTTAKIWCLKERRSLYTLRGHTGSVTAITTTLDSRLCVTASNDASAIVWNVRTGKRVSTYARRSYGDGGPESALSCVAIHGNMCVVGSVSGKVSVCDDIETLPHETHWCWEETSGVLCVAFAPFGKTIATGTKKGRVTLTASRMDPVLVLHTVRMPAGHQRWQVRQTLASIMGYRVLSWTRALALRFSHESRKVRRW